MDKKWEPIELLSWYRHDWLNRMQLIKGHMDLGKTEYVKEIVETIINQARNEAAVSNLNMPKFAELLITSNWRFYPFSVGYEVLQVNKGCRNYDEILSDWVETLLHAIGESVDKDYDNSLEIGICQSDGGLRFTFDLQGKIKDKLRIIKFLDEHCPFTDRRVTSLTDDEFVLEIKLDHNQTT